MKLLFSLGITLCFLQYVAPKVDIPAIFQKPKKKLDIPTPKSLDIREATSEEYDCVGKPDGNNANPSGDCKSFFACVKNTTYYVVCPEFPAYQTYFNPVRKLCDKSDPLACLQALEALDVKEEDNEEKEKKSVQDDNEEENTKKDNKESNDDEESEKGEENEEDPKSDEIGDKSSVDDNNSEENEDTEKSNSSEEDSSKEENEKDEL